LNEGDGDAEAAHDLLRRNSRLVAFPRGRGGTIEAGRLGDASFPQCGQCGAEVPGDRGGQGGRLDSGIAVELGVDPVTGGPGEVGQRLAEPCDDVGHRGCLLALPCAHAAPCVAPGSPTVGSSLSATVSTHATGKHGSCHGRVSASSAALRAPER
jgi:hypothetical protein